MSKLRLAWVGSLLAASLVVSSVRADDAPARLDVPSQPLLAQVQRLTEAMDVVGRPFSREGLARVAAIKGLESDEEIVAAVQNLFDPLCLAVVDVPKSGPPKVSRGPADAELLEQGWRTFLVKVINRHGAVGQLAIESANARPIPRAPANEVESRWMKLSVFEGQPLRPNLSGLALEYRIVQIFSRDAGKKSGRLEFIIRGAPGSDRELVHRWRFDQGTDGWRPLSQVELQAVDGALEVESSGNDPYMSAKVRHRRGPMVLRFRATTEVDGHGQLFWSTQSNPRPTGDRRVDYRIQPGKSRTYEVPFEAESELQSIRIDPLVKPGKIRFDWIDLYAVRKSAAWGMLSIEFESRRATPVTLRVRDLEGLPAFARFEIRDGNGEVYPAQSKRLAPDFFFQRHIYRGDGETVSLPPGDYTVLCSRGPETVPEAKTLTVGEKPAKLVYRVNRWVDPSKLGWWSGDHHIHAAGCAHYSSPTEGVAPSDMIRHIMGEDLKVGCCLTWGPCFDFQKRFFTGEVADQSRYPYLLRYDVEVSGFGSHVSGHLNLLNLKNQIYPGGESKDHWPTLGLNTLRWAKRQGAICGPAHSASGLTRSVGRLPNTEGRDGPHSLPNFDIPAYDGIGANEFIVDVTHEVPGPDGKLVPAVDFISTMDTDRVAELNMWYHVLNCGFRVVASGETDFPCISDERVGAGRVYAKVDGRLTFQKWVKSVADGRSYVSDGLCHLMNFSVFQSRSKKTVNVGEEGSEIRVELNEKLTFKVIAASRLDGAPELPVELILNGYPVDARTIVADGSTRELTFDVRLDRSGWIAVRSLPRAHTNPIFVVVDGKPVRGSIDSARWALAGVEQCWKSKQPTYAPAEQADAKVAYDHARKVFRKLIETHPDRN